MFKEIFVNRFRLRDKTSGQANSKGTKKGRGDAPPILEFKASRSLTGYQLFSEAHCDEVNAHVNNERETSGASHKEHAGLWQTKMKQDWNALPNETKADWDRKALDQKPDKEFDADEVYT